MTLSSNTYSWKAWPTLFYFGIQIVVITVTSFTTVWTSYQWNHHSHVVCCCRLDLASHAADLHSWRGQADTSCRRSGGRARVWAPCCGNSICRWDMCPWVRRCLAASASPPRLANFLLRFPRWWQCRRCQHFRHFHPFFSLLLSRSLQSTNQYSVAIGNKG